MKDKLLTIFINSENNEEIVRVTGILLDYKKGDEIQFIANITDDNFIDATIISDKLPDKIYSYGLRIVRKYLVQIKK